MNWSASVEQLTNQPDDNLKDWLTKPCVLSKALRSQCPALELSVLFEGFDTILQNESAQFPGQLDERFFVRKVRIYENSRTLILARTIMPESTHKLLKTKLAALGNQFIGESLLYADPSFVREPFEYCYCKYPDDGVIVDGQQLDSINYFARRSKFTLANTASLLITEYFMPLIQELPYENSFLLPD